MSIKFNFEAISEHTSTLHTIIDAMEQNCAHIASVRDNLLNTFQGAGASGYEDVMRTLNGKLTDYNTSLATLKASIVNASDLMNITDTHAGNSFRHLV